MTSSGLPASAIRATIIITKAVSRFGPKICNLQMRFFLTLPDLLRSYSDCKSYELDSGLQILNSKRDYKNYTSKGVEFIREPSKEDYGIVSVFKDLYGNLWDLIEPVRQ
jgi:hypothetical protein